MAKPIVREVYDMWENSLGWVIATVADDFPSGGRLPLPADAPKQYFATFREVENALRNPGDFPPKAI